MYAYKLGKATWVFDTVDELWYFENRPKMDGGTDFLARLEFIRRIENNERIKYGGDVSYKIQPDDKETLKDAEQTKKNTAVFRAKAIKAFQKAGINII